VQNWSLVEVVSLPLNILMLVPFFARIRPWRVFRERGAISRTAWSEGGSTLGGTLNLIGPSESSGTDNILGARRFFIEQSFDI